MRLCGSKAMVGRRDAVAPVSVDDRYNPEFARVQVIDGDEMRDRFGRAYMARKKAGQKMPIGRGVRMSLYRPGAQDPVSHMGAGRWLEIPVDRDGASRS
jgi:hypothetical protein